MLKKVKKIVALMMATMALSTLFVTTAFAQENDVQLARSFFLHQHAGVPCNGRDRIGQIILAGKELHDCEERLDEILSKINIEFTV